MEKEVDNMEFLKKTEKGDFTVYHNGNNVLSCSSGKEVVDYIVYTLNLYLDAGPRLIVDEVLDTCTELGGEYIILVYEYVDMCREFFIVESN